MALYAYRNGKPLYADNFFDGGIDKFIYKNVTCFSMTHISDLRLVVAKVIVLERLKEVISDYYKVNAVIWNGSHICAEGNDYILNAYDIRNINASMNYFIQSDDFTYTLNSVIESTMTYIHAMASAPQMESLF